MSSCASQKGSILKWNKNTKFRMAFDFYFHCHAFNLSVFVWDAELWKGLNVFCGLRFLLSLIQTSIADISFDKNNIRPTVSKGCLTLGSFASITYRKLLNHLTIWAFFFLSNFISGKYCSITLLSGYLTHKNINFAFLKCIGDTSELWKSYIEEPPVNWNKVDID